MDYLNISTITLLKTCFHFIRGQLLKWGLHIVSFIWLRLTIRTFWSSVRPKQLLKTKRTETFRFSNETPNNFCSIWNIFSNHLLNGNVLVFRTKHKTPVSILHQLLYEFIPYQGFKLWNSPVAYLLWQWNAKIHLGRFCEYRWIFALNIWFRLL